VCREHRSDDVLTEAGYTVTVEEWGCHNTVITSIRKDDAELIPHDDPDYQFGYDDPRARTSRKR
jgi:hypothetical protein